MPSTTDTDTLGLYLSVPFCQSKCTFCNFASDVFPAHHLDLYVARLLTEIRSARDEADLLGAHLPDTVDTVYFGGGTPSLLSPTHLRAIFIALRDTFHLTPTAEITVEAAPGQIPDPTLDELLRQDVNRLSLGIQSFADRETAATGRLHTRAVCLAEIHRLQTRGIPDLSLDLIAGLPHQTETSWRHTLADALSAGVPHLSVYMLEIDSSSRLGHELLTGGTRYGAPTVPTDDESAHLYELACSTLTAAGFDHYEISNFARPGHQSRHNLKYWHRQPYLGFGVDAHSMLHTPTAAIRFNNTADLNTYLAPSTTNTQLLTRIISTKAPRAAISTEALKAVISTEAQRSGETCFSPPQPNPQGREAVETVTPDAALEETLFLGLRLTAGISLRDLRSRFGPIALHPIEDALPDLITAGLLAQTRDQIRLTARGRVVSNEVFSRLLLAPVPA